MLFDALQAFEKGVADINSRDVIEMMMITQVRHCCACPCLSPVAVCCGFALRILQLLLLNMPSDCIELFLLLGGEQYFDMLKDVGEKNSTIFLNHSPNAVNDLSAQV